MRRGREVPVRPRRERAADRGRHQPDQRAFPSRMKTTFLLACLLALASPARAEQVAPPQPVETPPAAAAEGTTDTGTVVLLVTVGADGLVRDVSVAQTAGPALDAAAVAAVMRWKFRPALRDGQPFEARVRAPCRVERLAVAQGRPELPAHHGRHRGRIE